MIFLIEYKRSEGCLVTFHNFDDSQRQNAQEQRLILELDLNRHGVDHEVVLLEAESETALRRTHKRYFEGLRTLLESTAAAYRDDMPA